MVSAAEKEYKIFEDVRLLKETDLSYLFRIELGEYWIPKSVCKVSIGESFEVKTSVQVEKWFAQKMDDKGALFSDDKKHRYVLWRNWNTTKKIALVIGLNPSTANESKNDPTIDRLVSTLVEQDFGGFRMVNLFSIISSNPKILKDDSVRKDMAADLGIVFGNALLCQDIIFGWGGFKEANERASKIIEMFPDAKCFGKNKNGSPWHPMALMYAGLKPDDVKLFKYSNHTYELNHSSARTKKRRMAIDSKIEMMHTQEKLFK